MKKQVFLILVLAIFAISFSTSYGQNAIQGFAPRPLTCVAAGPLAPIAGVPYDYSALLNPAAGSAYWYATTSTSFMAAGARVAGIEAASPGSVVAAATNYMNNALGATSPSTTNITWSSAGLFAATVASGADPKLFVVVEYTAPAAGCANNMKVYPITPINAFTVDITNVNAGVSSAYDALVEQCFDKIQSAVFTGGVIDYDFGTNILYFEVVAANFTGSFTPTFLLGGLGDTQTADIAWDVAVGGGYANSITTGTGNGTYAGSAVPTLLTNTSAGVSIYVKVTIHNDDFEGLLAEPITLAVDAVNFEGQIDVVNSDCSPVIVADFVDVATQNLNPRPTVTEGVPTIPFIPKK